MARRNKSDSSAVLNELLRENGDIKGLKESQSNYLSNNLGSERDARGGICTLINQGSAKITTNADFSAENGYCISFWYYKEASHEGKDFRVIGDEPTGIKRVRILVITSTQFFLEINFDYTTGVNRSIQGTFIAENDKWVHITVSANLYTQGYFYTNGIATESFDSNSIPIPNIQPISFFNSNTSVSGKFFDIRIYEAELSAQDVQAIYNFGKTSIAPVHHFKLAEESGTTVYSSSGNKSVGTIVDPLPDNGNWGEQDVYSFADVEGFGISPYKAADPTNILGSGVSGDFLYRNFDFATVGNEGVVGGIYTDSEGDYIYCVSSLRIELSGFSEIFRGSRVEIKGVFQTGATFGLRESADVGSLYNTLQSYAIDKGITFTPLALFDFYNQTATEAEKAELDNVFTSRGVIGGYLEYYGNLPASWQTLTEVSFRPEYQVDISVGLEKTINIPYDITSTNIRHSNIQIKGTLVPKVDGSVITGVNESKLYKLELYTEGLGTKVPRDDTQLPALKDVLGNPLQFKGIVPSKALYGNGRCFEGDGSVTLENPNILADFTAEVYGSSATPTISAGVLTIANLDKVYGLILKDNGGAIFGIYPLCENGTTRYDVSVDAQGNPNGNHLTLQNPSPNNNVGYQDEYFYVQEGFLKPNFIPLLSDGSAFADGTPLSDQNAVLQNGGWLNDGSTTIEQQQTPRMVGTELDGGKTWAEVTTGENAYVDETDADKKTNVRVFNKALNGVQNDTELRITKNK